MPVATNFYWIKSVEDVVVALLSTIQCLSSSGHILSSYEVEELLRLSFQEINQKKIRYLTYERDFEELRHIVLQMWKDF